jgi:hypothetical protein
MGVGRKPHTSSRSTWSTWLGLAVGVLLTPFAMILSLFSTGAGHGDYSFARAIYPIPMLLTLITHDTITLASIALASVQYPVIGLATGFALRRSNKSFLAVTFVLMVVHVAALMLAFGGYLPNFSR